MDFLSSGFSRVDSSQNPGVFFSCLNTLSSLPYFQDYKEKSFKLLNPKNGSKILEIGCGLGQDASAVSQMVGEQGFVVAADASLKMVQAACKCHVETEYVRFCLADACRLPFRDEVFDGARADRVLQHLFDPGKAIAETVRTIKDKGRLVAYEPDWGTFIINSFSPGQEEICRIMTRLFGDTFPCGLIGRRLPGLFREEGLEEIRIEGRTFFTEDLNIAIQVFDLVNNAHRADRMGFVSGSQADGWLEGLMKADKQGRFFCSYTGFLVSGQKPG